MGASLQHAGRAGLYSTLTAIAAATQLALLLLAIPRYGLAGAVAANIAGHLLKLILIWVATRRHAPAPWQLDRLVTLAAVLLGSYALAARWDSAPWAQLAVCLAAPVMLIAAGFLTADERARLAEGWRRLRGR
jgi:O-antigen/teichoic acid export membrane protein